MSDAKTIDSLMKPYPYSRIQAFFNLPDDALIRVYSYQGPEAYALAQERGYWTGTDEGLHANDAEEWNLAYDWIRDHMAGHMPGFSGDRPMWAWLKRPSAKPKPKKERGTFDQYRLTCLIPKSRILLSDYETWHLALNAGPLVHSSRLWDEYVSRWSGHYSTYPPEKRAAYVEYCRSTWDGILKFIQHKDPEKIAWHGPGRYFRPQACIDRIYPHEIVDIREFPTS